ncbi:hypothetical protein D9M71_706650 [compost metagenome]
MGLLASIVVICQAQTVITGLSVPPPKNGRLPGFRYRSGSCYRGSLHQPPHQLQPENYGQMTSLPVQFFPRCAMEQGMGPLPRSYTGMA